MDITQGGYPTVVHMNRKPVNLNIDGYITPKILILIDYVSKKLQMCVSA